MAAECSVGAFIDIFIERKSDILIKTRKKTKGMTETILMAMMIWTGLLNLIMVMGTLIYMV